jgi:hypothetical protein
MNVHLQRMAEATRLTRAGRLAEATALLRGTDPTTVVTPAAAATPSTVATPAAATTPSAVAPPPIATTPSAVSSVAIPESVRSLLGRLGAKEATTAPPPAPTPAAPGRLTRHTHASGHGARDYLLCEPTSAPAGVDRPLIVVLHGGT